jgi:hypothetical protein
MMIVRIRSLRPEHRVQESFVLPLVFLSSCALGLLSLEITEWLALAPDAVRGNLAAGAPALALLRRRRGRPRKFDGPSRTVTLTLPETVLETLSSIHHDLSRAIVGLVSRKAPRATRKAAELLVFGQRAVITIRPTPSLELRSGVQLVPLPDGRALISFRDPTSLSALQLSIADALEDPALNKSDRAVYEHLSEILRQARRSDDISVEQRHIIVLESTRATRGNGKSSSRGRNSNNGA